MNILNKPYPLNLVFKNNLKLTIFNGLFIFIFLYAFQPINAIYGIEKMTLKESLHYGIITMLVVFFFFNVLPKMLLKYFQEKKWTVLKEIIYLIVIVLFIAFTNLLYVKFVGQEDLSLKSKLLYQIVGSTFLIAIIPIIINVLYKQNRLLKKYKSESDTINKLLKKKSNKNKLIINGKGKNENLKIEFNDLLFIKSQGNYCEFFLKNTEQPILLRNSLTDVEQQFSSTIIYKCHRSYLVNLEKVVKVTGNAQGLKLYFNSINNSVPVSRNLTTEIKQLLMR